MDSRGHVQGEWLHALASPPEAEARGDRSLVGTGHGRSPECALAVDAGPRRRCDPARPLRRGGHEPPPRKPHDRRGQSPPGRDLLLADGLVQALPPQPALDEALGRPAGPKREDGRAVCDLRVEVRIAGTRDRRQRIPREESGELPRTLRDVAAPDARLLDPRRPDHLRLVASPLGVLGRFDQPDPLVPLPQRPGPCPPDYLRCRRGGLRRLGHVRVLALSEGPDLETRPDLGRRPGPGAALEVQPAAPLRHLAPALARRVHSEPRASRPRQEAARRRRPGPVHRRDQRPGTRSRIQVRRRREAARLVRFRQPILPDPRGRREEALSQ